METIDRSSPIPIYYQLKSAIQAQIEQELFKPGDQLPTEQELCDQYGISRSPVRQALNELVYEGVIVRRPAIGTFVTARAQALQQAEIPIRVIGTDTRWSTILRRAATEWNEEHPNQLVALQVDLVPHDELHDALGSAVGDGTAPDIAMLDCVWVAEFAKAGYLFPLEELDPEWTLQQYATDIYPAPMEANSFKGALYAVQFEGDVSLLWYRKDWLEREGYRPPRDWNELVAVAQHFVRPEVVARYGSDPYAIAFPGGQASGEATVYNLMPLVWSAGGHIFGDGAVSLDSPPTWEALGFLRHLIHEGLCSPTVVDCTWDSVARLFAQGRYAMALGGSYEIGLINEVANWDSDEFDRHVGLVPAPAAPGREPVVTLGGMSCAVFRQSRHPQAAMGILQIAMRPELLLDFCRLTLQQSPRPSVGRQFAESDPFLAQTARMLVSARARPPIPEYAKVSRQLQRMFETTLRTTDPIPHIVARTSEFISVISDYPLAPTPESVRR